MGACIQAFFFGERILVLTPGAPRSATGIRGGSLEDLFHLVVVILIQTLNLLRIFRMLRRANRIGKSDFPAV
jgi:hypothetical protein